MDWLLATLIVLLGALGPWVFVYFAWRKLRRQREVEFNALGDDNTVTADPEGERKTHEYLTAITSTEARIGLLQRSQPWPGDKPPSAQG